MKVVVAVLDSPSLTVRNNYGLCGCNATLNWERGLQLITPLSAGRIVIVRGGSLFLSTLAFPLGGSGGLCGFFFFYSDDSVTFFLT